MLSEHDQQMAIRAAAQFLSIQQQQQQQRSQYVTGSAPQLTPQQWALVSASISPASVIGYQGPAPPPPTVVFGGGGGACEPPAALSAFQAPYQVTGAPTHVNYYSQTHATAVASQQQQQQQRQQQQTAHYGNQAPLLSASASSKPTGSKASPVSKQYIGARVDSDAVAAQVAIEQEQRDKEQARLHAIKWGNQAEAERIAQRRTDIVAMGLNIQRDNEQALSEYAAQQLQREFDAAAPLPPPPPRPSPIGHHYNGDTLDDNDSLTRMLPTPPTTLANSGGGSSSQLRIEDLVLIALGINARQLLQNHVVAAVETLIAVLLSIVFFSKVDDLLCSFFLINLFARCLVTSAFETLGEAAHTQWPLNPWSLDAAHAGVVEAHRC